MRSGYFISSVEQDLISGLDKSLVPTVSVTFSKQELWSNEEAELTCTIIYFGGSTEHQNKINDIHGYNYPLISQDCTSLVHTKNILSSYF